MKNNTSGTHKNPFKMIKDTIASKPIILGLVTIVLSIISLTGWIGGYLGWREDIVSFLIIFGGISNLGIHDFIMGKIGLGFSHIILLVTPFILPLFLEVLLFFLAFLLNQLYRQTSFCDTGCEFSSLSMDDINSTIQLGLTAIFISNSVLSLVEGIMLVASSLSRKNNRS